MAKLDLRQSGVPTAKRQDAQTTLQACPEETSSVRRWSTLQIDVGHCQEVRARGHQGLCECMYVSALVRLCVFVCGCVSFRCTCACVPFCQST